MFQKDKKRGYQVFNKRDNFLNQSKTRLKDKLFLFLSIFIMLVIFVAIFLESIGFFGYVKVVSSQSFFADFLFWGGALINFVCVPILYWSCFNKFQKDDEFWNDESFWILPLFFFGSFFQYLSKHPYSIVMLPFSLMLIFFVHIWVMVISSKISKKKDNSGHESEFLKSFTYLTAYYLALGVVVMFFNLFESLEYWIN